MLSPTQISQFQEKGYLKLPGLLEEKYALQIQEEIWSELEAEFGIKKSDKTTWKTPLHSPRKTKLSPTNEVLINQNFRSAIDSLIGKENWIEPSSWGGFLVTFPDKEKKDWNLHDKLWHWDYELFRGPELKGLLIFSFFSEVKSRGGGTLIASGSHKALENYYASLTEEQKKWKHGQQRKHFYKTNPYFQKLTDPKLYQMDHVAWFMDEENIVDDIPLQVLELTGQAGDVVFCHPRLIHAPAGINLNEYPRMMRTKFLW